ncbi:hypothetical protein QTP88_024423 [Uroleucon formosanum]
MITYILAITFCLFRSKNNILYHYSLSFQYISKEDFNKTYNKIIVSRQKQMDQHLHSLHDPFDLNHIYGLRNRLFITFNEFSKILENALLPPVLKGDKEKKIKIKDCDQITNNFILDLNSLFKVRFELENNAYLEPRIKLKLVNSGMQPPLWLKKISFRKLFLNIVNYFKHKCSHTMLIFQLIFFQNVCLKALNSVAWQGCFFLSRGSFI